MHYRDKKVKANHAVAAGKLDESAINLEFPGDRYGLDLFVANGYITTPDTGDL